MPVDLDRILGLPLALHLLLPALDLRHLVAPPLVGLLRALAGHFVRPRAEVVVHHAETVVDAFDGLGFARGLALGVVAVVAEVGRPGGVGRWSFDLFAVVAVGDW